MVKFIDPNLEDIFKTLTNNDRLTAALNKDNLILRKDMLYADYDQQVLQYMESQLYLDNINTMYNLGSVLLSNHDRIMDTELKILLDSKFLYNDIKSIFGEMDISNETYHEIFYCYKYCSISSFFQNNMKHFVPEYDLDKVQTNEMMSALMDSINKEFDKLDYVLSSTRQFQSVDEIEFKHINYLSQMFGYETKNFYEDSERKYRQIIKNIIEIYKIKGTNYSFELFFSFLGFNIKIEEYYFDRRTWFKENGYNEETEISDILNKEYYLTIKNPLKNEIKNITTSEIVLQQDITQQYSLLEFEELIQIYGPECVIGYSPVDKNGKQYTGKIYKYFKTNYIYYNISLDRANPTENQILAIRKYLEFLTPAFVMKILAVDVYNENSEDQIIFDGDGEGDGDQYGKKPTDFEMLDSEDWVKWNNDERSFIDGNISISNAHDYNLTQSERIPVRTRWFHKSINKYVGQNGRPIIRWRRLLCFYDNVKATWHIDIPPSGTMAEGKNNVHEWYTPDWDGIGTITDRNKVVNDDINSADDKQKTKVNFSGSDNSLKEFVHKNKYYKEIDFCIQNNITDFIENDEYFNELIVTKGDNLIFTNIRSYGNNVTFDRNKPIGRFDASLGNYNSIFNALNGDQYIIIRDGIVGDIRWKIGDKLLVLKDNPTTFADIQKITSTTLQKIKEEGYNYTYIYRSLSEFNNTLSTLDKNTYKYMFNGCYVVVFNNDSDRNIWELKKLISNNNYINGSYSLVLFETQAGKAKDPIYISNGGDGSDAPKINISNQYSAINVDISMLTFDQAQTHINELLNSYRNDNTLALYEKEERIKILINSVVYVTSLNKYYNITKQPTQNAFVSQNNLVFRKYQDAINFFNDNPNRKYNMLEFYINGEENLLLNGLYRFIYKRKVNGTTIYVVNDGKLYTLDGGIHINNIIEQNIYGRLIIINNGDSSEIENKIGRFVTIGYNSKVSSYSDDGMNWFENTLPMESSWYKIAYGNNRFVALGYNSNISYYSDDGINWLQSTMPYGRWYDVAYGGGKFVSIKYNSNISIYSDDGINWVQGLVPTVGNFKLAYLENVGMFVGVSNNSDVIITSYDGIIWDKNVMPVVGNYSIASDGEKLVAINNSSEVSIYSEEGVEEGKGEYLITIGGNSNIVFYSIDAGWQQSEMPISAKWSDITYGNGKFVAIATNSNISAYSDDGITWTQTQLPDDAFWYKLVYGDGKFIAVASSSNKSAYSDDGINWTSNVIPIINNYGITFGEVIAAKLLNATARIYEYDSHYRYYNEEADEEDFIFYNVPGKDENYSWKHYIDFENINGYFNRPIYEIIERDFNEKADGEWLIKYITNRSVRYFTDGEIHKRTQLGHGIFSGDFIFSVSNFNQEFIDNNFDGELPIFNDVILTSKGEYYLLPDGRLRAIIDCYGNDQNNNIIYSLSGIIEGQPEDNLFGSLNFIIRGLINNNINIDINFIFDEKNNSEDNWSFSDIIINTENYDINIDSNFNFIGNLEVEMEPTSLIGAIEYFIETFDNGNTLVEHYSDVSDFILDYYKYIIYDEPISSSDGKLEQIWIEGVEATKIKYRNTLQYIINLTNGFIKNRNIKAYNNEFDMYIAGKTIGNGKVFRPKKNRETYGTSFNYKPNNEYNNYNGEKDNYETDSATKIISTPLKEYINQFSDSYDEMLSQYHDFLSLCLVLLNCTQNAG